MAKTDALQGSLDLLVLKVLSRRAPLHGYAIISAIKEISQEALRVEQGSLYPALHRMEEAGFVHAKWIAKGPGRRARIYHLTERGRRELATEEARWTAVTVAVQRVLKFV
jgi:PadR family transcriptional regulator, regulatory protein PadR